MTHEKQDSCRRPQSDVVKVWDGYRWTNAIPANEGDIVIIGDGRKLPKGSSVWLPGHGSTGWYDCERMKMVIAESVYEFSVPASN